MNITFKEITKNNLYPLSLLKLTAEQEKFVASNIYSVAQSKFHPDWHPLGIYNDDTLIGFFMYGVDDTDNTMWIIRMMIDIEHQGKGYGKEAMRMMLERIRTGHEHKEVFLCFVPTNERAKKMYESFGFTDTGKFEDDEMIYNLKF